MAEQQPYDEPEQLEGGPGRRLPGLLQVAWHHKSLIVIGLITALAAGAVVYSQITPLYQSAAQVLVVQKRPELSLPGTDMRGSFAEDYLGMHQVMIKSPLLVGNAVEKHNLRALPSFAGQADPTRAIIEQLKVSREKDAANILILTFRGPVAEDCPIVLTALVDAYKDFLKTTYQNVSENTVEFITKAQDLLEKKLDKKEKEHGQFRLDHPGLLRGDKGTSVLQEQLLKLATRKGELKLKQAELKGRLQAFTKAVDEGRGPVELKAMISDTTRRLMGDTLKASLKDDPILELELQLQKLMETYAQDYPEVKSLKNKIEKYRSFFTEHMSKDASTVVDPIKAHIRFLEQELEDARYEMKGIEEVLKDAQEEAKELVKWEVKENEFNNDITRNRQLFDTIVKRLNEINIVKDLGGYDATPLARASTGYKVAPRGALIIGVAAVLGLLCGLGLAYAAEISDNSFRTPEEIRQQLGLPVVGHIPFIKSAPAEMAEGAADAPRLAAMIHSFYQPKSHVAESYRGVRTAMFFSARKDSIKLIQVTSPDMGDGKSTLAANLVVSIAQSGKRIILLDADFRRPQVHKMFGASNERGLACVMAGEAELADVIQQTAVPGLFVLPCGPHPPNPAELLNRPKLKELLEYLRGQYDFVIVDTPPILAVTDPCVVVPHVDGVILTIRVGKNVRPHAQRTRKS